MYSIFGCDDADLYKNNGLVNESCCVCGGGNIEVLNETVDAQVYMLRNPLSYQDFKGKWSGAFCNSNETVFDKYGDSCEWYDRYPDQCGNYDDDDFNATIHCCAC